MTLSQQVRIGRAECQHNATNKNNRTPYGKTYMLHCGAMKGATLDGQFLPHKPKNVSPQAFGIRLSMCVHIRHIFPRR
jgi:hypothetical protein